MTSLGSEYAFVRSSPTAISPAAPGHRQHRQHTPALSTTLGAVQRLGSHLTTSTPASATSLSSPFASYASGGFSASPGSTPSTARSTAPYNPQQWGSGAGGSSIAASGFSTGVTGPRGEDLIATSPPPPYSPQRPRHERRTSPQDATHMLPQSASPGVSYPQYNAPVSAVSAVSAVSSVPSLSYQDPATSRVPSTTNNSTNSSTGPLHFPPPPGTSSAERRTRSSSRSRNERTQPLFSLSALTSRARPSNQLDSATSQYEGRQNAFNAVRSHTVAGPSSDAQSTADTTRPPSARRAASTGAISGPSGAPRARTNHASSSHPSWEPGMPLPPPPPGPPPSNRSQSLNRTSDTTTSDFPGLATHPTRRPPPMGSRLPPVPPTPADWNEDPAGATDSAALPRQRLQIDTSQVEPRFQQTEDDTAVSSTVAGSAEPGSDHPHASTMKGIRERRSESRTGKGRMIEPTSNFGNASSRPSPDQDSEVGVRPADLVLPTGNMKLARRPAVSKSTPRSARSVQSEGVPGSANSTNSPPGLESASTLESTPKLNASRDIRSPMPIAPTPPFSPGSRKQEPSPPIPPKSLPTPPLQNALQPDFRLSTTSQHASHPYHSSGHQAWPGQSFPPTPGPRTVSQDGQGTDEFVRSAIDRHRQFVEQESSATSDMERVQLFAAFIVSESRLRRENYAAAIDAMGSDVLELTRDLFRPYAKAPLTGQSPAESERSSHNGSLNSALHASSKVVESPKPRPESTWWSGYMPSLSPIPSMSVSEAPDGMSSRGRPSSRWWEASQEGSIYGAGARGFERSKRESKYMGLPLRDWDDSPGSGTTTAGPSTQTLEYPPEKVGWHEEATPQSSGHGMLDVSRLVTLPPPYPRHHPAVNNNHPNLTPIRNIVRSIADFKETTEVKERFASDCLSKKEQVHLAHKQTQNDVRRQIEVGTMSYAEAARIEASQKGQKQAVLKDQFERFEQTVMSPLKALLLERITHATAAFDSLRSHLVEQNPMEEGDEKPELLEKLTLLKWLFEAREQVHREIFTLNSSRNEHYKAMVIAPYDQEHKVREAEAFFARDATQRQVAFEKETLQRHERFMDLVEDTVKKGVEVQLSAFWDIAPSLVEVIQRVDVSQGVQTDGDYEFSQQYLWEVLCHAEQSTYQFIEGQINLLCLLHEVKSSVTKQSFKVMQMEGQAPGLDRGEQTDGLLRDEEERLTTDLKEKVTMIEKQWSEAMGTAVDEVKCDAQAWLEANGGWEGLEDV